MNIKKIIPYSVKLKIKYMKELRELRALTKTDTKRFSKYSFGLDNNVDTFQQLEARITKAYHSIEKGLSNQHIRLGFGSNVLTNLINLMRLYKSKGYPLDSECYQTALSNLDEYIILHEKENYDVSNLKREVIELGENFNNDESGGILDLSKEKVLRNINNDFKDFSSSRHSIRNFSKEPVNIEVIERAIKLAQNTPSACNRQGWKIRIITKPEVKKVIENNQNGNRGFGSDIDKFILVTMDSQYFAKARERNQPFIDGGMYAMNLLYCLHYYGIATVPLSASLSAQQEWNIRTELDMEPSENFILFIGTGNYTDTFKIPKSFRRNPNISIY